MRGEGGVDGGGSSAQNLGWLPLHGNNILPYEGNTGIMCLGFLVGSSANSSTGTRAP